jgi:hypothetical protein
MIMMVPGVIFDLCNWRNSVTFIETFKMTPIMTNLNVFKFLNIPNWEAGGQNQGEVQGDGQMSL